MRNSEFGHVQDLLRRRWLAALIVCVIGFATIPFVAHLIPGYKGTAELLVVSEALKDTTLSDPDLPSILTSTEVLSRVINRLKLHTTPVELAKKVKTKLPPKSSIIELTYKDTDQAKSVAVTNAIAYEAAAYFHDIATRGYRDVISALNKRIADSKTLMSDSEKRLQQVSANTGFEGSDKGLDDLTSQIADLKVQRGQIGASLAADEATASAFKRQLVDIQPIVRGEILQKDIVYQQVQTEVGRDTADLVSERSSFRDSFPGLSALARRVGRERSEANSAATSAVTNGAGESPSYTQSVLDSERADGLVAADKNRLKATDAQLADEQQHLRQVAGPGAVIGSLRAERDAAVQQYVALTQRLSTAQGDAAQAASLGTLVVVSRAIPGTSSLWIWLTGLALLVIALAVGVAFAIEAMDRRFWGTREIERVYGRPVLVEVGGHAA